MFFMKIRKLFPTYQQMIKYLFLLLVFYAFNHLQKEVFPYSTAVFVVCPLSGLSILGASIVYVLSFLISGNLGLLSFALISATVYSIINFIYHRLNVKPKLELLVFSVIITSIYCIIGDTKTQVDLSVRITASIYTLLLTLISFVSVKSITEKGLKLKLGVEEIACLTFMVVLFGVGLCHALSPHLWKTACIFLIISCAFTHKKGVCTVFACLLGVSLSVYYGNINYVSVYALMGAISESLIGFSRYFSAIAILIIDYLAEKVFGVYGAYQLIDFISAFIGVGVFCVIPNKILTEVKDKLSTFREKQLTRIAINRNRTILSNRLYELSTVFTEMSNAMFSFKKVGLTEEKAKNSIITDMSGNVCVECENRMKCKKFQTEMEEGLNKLVEIGFAKGKISLIDLPKEFGGHCIHPNNVLYFINKLLADYRQISLENANVDTGRQLIAEEIKGVSNILKELALDSGAMLKYHSKLERLLSEKLMQNGFIVSELLIYGEDNRLNVGMVLTMKEFMTSKLEKVIKKTLGVNMTLTEKFDVGGDKCYLSFRKDTPYDIIYGLARAVKDNSSASGDTHSVTRINENKYLIALSDGMGSGETANNVSDVSLSLIESFYKAGMKSELILTTVSRLMSISAEENFTALDVSILDLTDCSVDFIKYGSPYGFIINDKGIRIIEGSSLPLGILSELKPSVCKTKLQADDMIVFLTDGVSDAFKSSNCLIEYIKSLPALNPQTLADDLLKKAVELSNGNKNDDMTVLATRIIKKAI